MGFPSGQQLLWNAMLLIPLALSLTVHEWAHAVTANWLGDDTAARAGRLTLDPLVHMDPLGTFLLPLLGVPFGWAKPVPVRPERFRRDISMGTGMALTAFAGPLSNFLLAVGCALTFGLLYRVAPTVLEERAVSFFLSHSLLMNVGLAVFNLLPIPPLDGSRIVERLVPLAYRDRYQAFARLSPVFLLVLLAGGGAFLSGPIRLVSGALYQLVAAVAE